MRSRYFRSILVPFLMLVFVLPACAQVTTADLTGHVLDPKGLAVVGAAISVTSRDTGAKRDAVSGDDGGFSVPLLPVGQYRVTVSKAGFATAAYDRSEEHTSE